MFEVCVYMRGGGGGDSSLGVNVALPVCKYVNLMSKVEALWKI